MSKFTIALLGVAGLSLLGSNVPESKAQGLHIRTHGLHLDIGRPHVYGYQSYRAYRPSVHVVPRYAPRPHLDYYPSRAVRHGNHYDIIPGHYRLHYGSHGHGYRNPYIDSCYRRYRY